jgi:hypothetical protein
LRNKSSIYVHPRLFRFLLINKYVSFYSYSFVKCFNVYSWKEKRYEPNTLFHAMTYGLVHKYIVR